MKGYNKSICCSILCNSKKEKQLKDVYKNGMPKETIHKMAYYIPVKMDVYMLQMNMDKSKNHNVG